MPICVVSLIYRKNGTGVPGMKVGRSESRLEPGTNVSR